MRIMDLCEDLFDLNNSSPPPFNPDLHIQSAIRIDKRALLIIGSINPDANIPITILKSAEAFNLLGFKDREISIESEFIYPNLWKIQESQYKSTKLEKLYARSLEVSKLLLRANSNFIFKNVSDRDPLEVIQHYNPSSEILQYNWLRSYWYFIRNTMYKKQTKKIYTFTLQKRMHPDSFNIYLSGSYAVVVLDDICYILDYDQVMLIHDTVTSRYLALLTCELYETANLNILPTGKLLSQVYNWGDSILKIKGNSGYDTLKNLEPVCTGAALNRLDTLNMSHEYYKKILSNCATNVSSKDLESLYTIICTCENPNQIFELFGCYRHFGHPTVDEEGGCKKMRDHTRGEWKIKQTTVNKITGAFNRCFILNFIQKHNRWPACKSLLHEEHILSKIITEQLLHFEEYSSSIHIQDWSQLTFEKEFEFDYFADFTELLSDKALSPYLNNWARVYAKDMIKVSYSTMMKESRRLLIEIIRRRRFDMRGICDIIMENRIPENWFIVGLHSKEREMKILARLFSMLVLEIRMYFCITEQNISKNIFKYLPGQTMTWGEAELMKHLQTITHSSNQKDSPFIPITISIDFVKWNNRWRKKSTQGIFSAIDQLFGTPNLLTFTHDFFEKAYFYLSSTLNPPIHIMKKINGNRRHPEKGIPLKNTFQESYSTWIGQEGGCEGLRQKGWTAVTLGMLLAAEYVTQVKSIITGQGDNQVVVVFIPMRLSGMTREEYSSQYSHLLENDIKEFLTVLKEIAEDIGMEIKLEESWVSQHIFNYGKEILVNGCFMTSVLKKISRAYLSVSESYPSIADRIASLHTATHAASLKNIENLLPYFVANMEVCLLLQYDSISSATLDDQLKRILEDHHMELSPELLLLFNILSKDLGGYPIMPFTEYMYRGHPDPLTSYLTWLAGIRETIPLADTIREWALSLDGISHTTDYKMLIQDPTSINWSKVENGSNIIKLRMEKVLSDTTLNIDIRDLIRYKSKKDADSLIDFLATCRPLSPRVLNDLFRNSPEGARLDFIATFTDMKTMKGLLPGRESHTLQDRLKQCDVAWFSYICDIYNHLNRKLYRASLTKLQQNCPKIKSLLLCSYQFAKYLRKQSWGIEISHVTVPHPAEQFKLVKDKGTTSSNDKEYILYSILQPTVFAIPGNVAFSRGNQEPYYGSSTSEKRSGRLISFPKTDRSFNAAQSLYRSMTWVCAPDSNLYNFIYSLIKARTDIPLEVISASSGICFGGSVAHRFGDVVTKHNTRPNIRGNFFTNIYISSDTLGKYSRGLENYTMHFQGSFLFGLTTLTLLGVHGLLSFTTHNLIYKHKVHCMSCCEKLEELYIDSTARVPRVRIYNNNNLLFSKVEEMADRLHWTDLNFVTLDYPNLADPHLTKKRCQAMAFSILGLALTNTTPLMLSPIGIPEKMRQNPSVTIGAFLQLGITNILQEYAKIWFYDNMISLLRTSIIRKMRIDLVIKMHLMKNPKLYWNSLRHLIQLPEIRDVFLEETGLYPVSSEAFKGNISLDMTLSNYVGSYFPTMIKENNLLIRLFSPAQGLSMIRLMQIWINMLCFIGYHENVHVCYKVGKFLNQAYNECIRADSFCCETFYFKYYEIRSDYSKLPDFLKHQSLNISKVGAEPWLKLPNAPLYIPRSVRLASNLLTKKSKRVQTSLMVPGLFALRSNISLVRSRIRAVNSSIPIFIGHTKKRSFATYKEHRLKLTGRYSSSHYKYLNILSYLQIQNVTKAICLGEGNGGVSKLLMSMYDIEWLYFNTLFSLSDFTAHRAVGYCPSELLVIRDRSKIEGIQDSILYGGDITDTWIQQLIINSAIKDNRPVNLITSDIEITGELSIDFTISLLNSIINIVSGVYGSPWVIFKTYCYSQEYLRIVASHILELGTSVQVIVPEWSAPDNTECFLVIKADKKPSDMCPAGHYKEWLIEETMSDLIQLSDNRHNQWKNIPISIMNKSKRINRMLESIGYHSNFSQCIDMLYGGYIQFKDFSKSPLVSLAVGMEVLYSLVEDRMRSYGLIHTTSHIPRLSRMNRSTITSECKDLLLLSEYLFNAYLTVILVRRKTNLLEYFYRGVTLTKHPEIVLFTYKPILTNWLSKYGRWWNKLRGHLASTLEDPTLVSDCLTVI